MPNAIEQAAIAPRTTPVDPTADVRPMRVPPDDQRTEEHDRWRVQFLADRANHPQLRLTLLN